MSKTLVKICQYWIEFIGRSEAMSQFISKDWQVRVGETNVRIIGREISSVLLQRSKSFVVNMQICFLSPRGAQLPEENS
jgi:hypothetical protein